MGLLNVLGAPTLLGIAATVLVLDAVSYAWHRANHRLAFLWRFHRVHHRDGSFNVSTALRFHPGEVLLSLPLRLAAVVLLGAPILGVAVFEAVFMCANVLEHGNFNLPRRLERVLSLVLVTPALHRWHHSREPSELNTNFGTVVTLWDRALGTFQNADSRALVTTGVPGVQREWRSLQIAIIEPFRASARA